MLETLLQSNELKKTLVKLSEENRIPFRYVCREAGIKYDVFLRKYLNSTTAPEEITEEQFLKVLNLFGITVRYTVVIDKNADLEALSRTLEEKYEAELNKSRKLDTDNEY